MFKIRITNFQQFLKFGVVGLSNTAVAAIVFYLLIYFNVHYIIANFISWMVSVYNAFYWNNKYVFKGQGSWLQILMKTYISYGITFFISTLLLIFIIDLLEITLYIAPIVVLVITVPINFILNKSWTFK